MNILAIFAGIALSSGLFGGLSRGAWAAETPADTAAASADTEDMYQPKPLDGVLIEAVETYPNSRDQELGLGVGLYPFNAYYSALLLNANYLHNVNRAFQWEILNASYGFTFDKDLTTELADVYGVNPRTIERLEFMLSSNAIFALTHGKFVFLKDYIRYFRSSAIGGLALVKTNVDSSIAVNLGFRLEVYTSEKFSWRLDVRDAVTVGGFNHFVTFTVGTGYSF